jgi:hypothetical protein
MKYKGEFYFFKGEHTNKKNHKSKNAQLPFCYTTTLLIIKRNFRLQIINICSTLIPYKMVYFIIIERKVFSFTLTIDNNFFQDQSTKMFSNISKFVLLFHKLPNKTPHVIFTYYTSLFLSQNRLWETA